MSSLLVQGLNLTAACPSGVVVGANTRFQGSIEYNLVNSGDADALVNSLAELVDSQGFSTTDSQKPLLVSAGGSLHIEHSLGLIASYDQPGEITVTVKLTITGALSFSDSTFCTFIVN